MVVAFLILMALLLAAVGGLGLTTTMSINMLERVREVGVLRAIGASNVSVRRSCWRKGSRSRQSVGPSGTVLSIFISPIFSEQLGLALIKISAALPVLVRGGGHLVLHPGRRSPSSPASGRRATRCG